MKRRLTALVIGNAAYPGLGALKNPANDANDIASRLETFGFSVSKAIDCSNKEMDVALKTFKMDLADCEVGLFFFAGHGMQIEGGNYLIAVDTDTSSETDAKHMSLSLDKVYTPLASLVSQAATGRDTSHLQTLSSSLQGSQSAGHRSTDCC